MKEIYPLLSNAMNQELRMGQIANNLANINTPGFKRDDSVFESMLNTALNAPHDPDAALAAENPAQVGWTSLVKAYTDFGQGELRVTGNPLDLAIDGEGFFMVRGTDGETYYTRAGNFKVNEKNELITPQGRPVLNAGGGPITIDLRQGKPLVLSDGSILQGKTTVAKVGVVKFDEPEKLVKYGDGALFTAPAEVTATPVTKPNVRQSMLEGSNVSAIDEMVRMIQTERSYQIQQRIMQTMDELTARRLDQARG